MYQGLFLSTTGLAGIYQTEPCGDDRMNATEVKKRKMEMTLDDLTRLRLRPTSYIWHEKRWLWQGENGGKAVHVEKPPKR